MSRTDFSDLFYYDETSPSCLRWKHDVVDSMGRVSGMKAGDVAGTILNPKTRSRPTSWQVQSQGKRYLVHRVIYTLAGNFLTDKQLVDHINGNGLDNRIVNLRVVTTTVNARNRHISSANTTGTTGVNRKVATVRGKEYSSYVAQWSLLDSTIKSKSFSTIKYGDAEALKLAIEYRRRMVEELNKCGAGYTGRHGT